MRVEDVGKMMLQNAEIKSKDEVVHQLKKFVVKNMGSKYFLLLSNKIGYYTVFKIKNQSIDTIADNIYSFLKESSYFDQSLNTYFNMSEIKYYEHNEGFNHLELWIGNEYFQLSDFSWGVEEI
jgi:hypothetical protein